MMRKIKTV